MDVSLLLKIYVIHRYDAYMAFGQKVRVIDFQFEDVTSSPADIVVCLFACCAFSHTFFSTAVLMLI